MRNSAGKCLRPAALDFSLNHNRLTLRARTLNRRNCLPVRKVAGQLSLFPLCNIAFFARPCRKSVTARGERPSLICIRVLRRFRSTQMITTRTLLERDTINIIILTTIIRKRSPLMEKVLVIFLSAKSEKPIYK